MQECDVNIHWSSVAMESEFTLVLTQKVFTDYSDNVYVLYIVSDDDSSMRIHLQHPSSDSKGRLTEDIPEPEFSASFPSHHSNVCTYI